MDAGLKLDELLKEAHVWADARPLVAEVLECLLEGHLAVLDEVGETEGGRARHTGDTMDERAAAFLFHLKQEG